MKTITPAECSQRMIAGQRALLIDVRTPAEFASLHAAGAESIPLDTLQPSAVAARRAGDDQCVYVICQSGARAAKACERLESAGLGEVFCVEGGTSAWEKSGLPVERRGGKVISLERQIRIVAGALVVIGVLLAWRVHPLFLALPAFVGAGLMFAGITDRCGMAMILAKMPWNRVGACPPSRTAPTAD